MKKLMYLILLTMLIVSCEHGDYESSVLNEETYTTVEKQQLPRDTVVIAIDESNIYFIEEDLIKAKAEFRGNDTVGMSTAGGWGFTIVIVFFIGVLLGVYLVD